MHSKAQAELLVILIGVIVIAVVASAFSLVNQQFTPAGYLRAPLSGDALCTNGQKKPCGSNIGECIAGEQVCTEGVWGECTGSTGPEQETCDGKDNDCDAEIDEEGVCTNTGSTPATGPISGTSSYPPPKEQKVVTLQNMKTKERHTYIFPEGGRQEMAFTYSSNGRQITGRIDAAGNVFVPEADQMTEFPFDVIDSGGYLVEFTEQPLAKYYSSIKDQKGAQEIKTLMDSQKSRIDSQHKSIQKSLGDSRISFKVEKEFSKVFNGMSIKAQESDIGKIRKMDGVRRVVPNRKVRLFLNESVPLINADDLWNLVDANGTNVTGAGITIGIIDTGIDYTHPDLGGCFGTGCKVASGWDFINGDADPIDDHGHGTHVAATAGGKGILNGVAPDAILYGYKVLDSGGSGQSDVIIASIERSADPNNDGDFSDHLDVISLSLGGGGDPDDPMSMAIDNVVDVGVVAVIAAGNSGGFNTVGSPGTSRKAITVAATNKTDSLASFSSRGPVIWGGGVLAKPDVAAPGVKICAAQWDSAWEEDECLDDVHTAISGTSMATPHVSGAVALLKQLHPEWTPQQIKSVLMLSGKDTTDENERMLMIGGGRIDLLAAKDFPFVTDPASFSFDLGSQTTSTQGIIITNLKDSALNIDLRLRQFSLENATGNVMEFFTNTTYSIVSAHSQSGGSSVSIPPYSQATIFMDVNLSAGFEGMFYGEIELIYNNEQYEVPFIFQKLSNITVLVDGGVNEILSIIFLYDNSLKILQSWDFDSSMNSAYTARVPGNMGYTILAFGDMRNTNLEYVLADYAFLPSSSSLTKTLRLSDARPFTVKAKSLQNTDLYLYEWIKEVVVYGTYGMWWSSSIYDPAIGDRTVYLTNKPVESPNLDVVFRYMGIPVA